MKKSLKLFVVSFIFMFALLINVNAQEVSQDTFKDCISKDGNTCKLMSDVVLDETVDISNNITIDLNGYNIKPSGTFSSDSIIIVVHGGELTVEDTSASKNGKITAGETDVAVGIKMTKAGYDTSKVASLIVNSGTVEGKKYGISGNGNPDRINTKIVINGGTIRSIDKEGHGVYHPQIGTLEINGGEIIGGTGIEMRSGNLTVNGGEITGNGVPTEVSANGNGTTTFGAGIAVAQHTTKNSINVTIKNGTIEGYTAFYESNPQNNSTINKVTLSITGGTFNSINKGSKALYSEDGTGFVKGGVFNSEIDTKYLDSNYVVSLTNGQYKVVENKTLESNDKNVVFESETALDNTYVLEVTELSDETKEEVETTLNKYYADNKEVKDTTLITVYDISVSDGSEVISMENGKFTISIDIDDDTEFDNYKVIYIDSEGNISEVLDAKRVGNKIVFETTHLSTYGVIGYNNATTTVNNPNTGDNLNMIILLGGLSLLILGMSAYKLSKNN